MSTEVFFNKSYAVVDANPQLTGGSKKAFILDEDNRNWLVKYNLSHPNLRAFYEVLASHVGKALEYNIPEAYLIEIQRKDFGTKMWGSAHELIDDYLFLKKSDYTLSKTEIDSIQLLHLLVNKLDHKKLYRKRDNYGVDILIKDNDIILIDFEYSNPEAIMLDEFDREILVRIVKENRIDDKIKKVLELDVDKLLEPFEEIRETLPQTRSDTPLKSFQARINKVKMFIKNERG